MRTKLVYGVGVNDANYPVDKRVHLQERAASGRKKQKLVWSCPYYLKWKNMLMRCYSLAASKYNPTYKDVTVCEEWLTFSNFRKWMEGRNWKGMHLDKDILSKVNKLYSPETCIFVHSKVNTYMNDCKSRRGDYLIGAYLPKDKRRFLSQCSNTLTEEREKLGYYDTEVEAHLAWKYRKYELGVALAKSPYVTDERVSNFLIKLYSNYNIVEDHIK